MKYQEDLESKTAEQEQLVSVTQEYEMKLRLLQAELDESAKKQDELANQIVNAEAEKV